MMPSCLMTCSIAATMIWLSAAGWAQRRFETLPIQVFIMAGQSNMEGKAKLALLNYQAEHEPHAAAYEHLRESGKWRVRNDVWIRFHERQGPLTVGFGSPECIGPELEFGTVLGDHLEAPILLIKTAWGGRSLYRDFRPPSAGLPPADVLDALLAAANKREGANVTRDEIVASFGASYREMLAEIRETLANLNSFVPVRGDLRYELGGFVWFQGWNDMINDQYTAEYSQNLAHFIRDVRRDLEAPNLPFVIGQMGVDGDQANAKVEQFKAAQAATAELPEFEKTVRLVRTDVFWDREAAEVFARGWKENLEEWNRVGSDFPYHYLGSGKAMLAIGRAFADAILELRGD